MRYNALYKYKHGIYWNIKVEAYIIYTDIYIFKCICCSNGDGLIHHTSARRASATLTATATTIILVSSDGELIWLVPVMMMLR